MGAVDHRFALGHTPALPSACSKKPLARVSSPILACSVFTSTGGLAAFSAPNTSAAPSRSWAFHWVIWLGGTSNCWASSAKVLSPFTAARATLALKAGEWFRRGLLLMVSPVQQPFWPLSGRNSTYLAVQISRACSPEPSASISPAAAGNEKVMWSQSARLLIKGDLRRATMAHAEKEA